VARRVNRGVIATGAQFQRAVSQMGTYSNPVDKASRRLEKLRTAVPHEWRELEDFCRSGYRGDHMDIRGHRLFSPKAKAEARWLARVSNQARKGKGPTSVRTWNHITRALTAIYQDLGELE